MTPGNCGAVWGSVVWSRGKVEGGCRGARVVSGDGGQDWAVRD